MKQLRGIAQALLIYLSQTHHHYCQAVPSSFIKSSFVPPASPSIVSHSVKNSPDPQILANRIMTGYGLFPSPPPSHKAKLSPLFAAKKRKGVKTDTGKLQVKLLKNVPGTGHQGQVIQVSPAFFQNKLVKDNAAVLITDDEVSAMNEKREKKAKEQRDVAEDMKGHLEGYELILKRKAGPEGHLFGGVGKKVILEELRTKFPKGALDGKAVKVLSVQDGGGEEMAHDIKEIGGYKVTVGLLSDVSAEITVSVIPEE